MLCKQCLHIVSAAEIYSFNCQPHQAFVMYQDTSLITCDGENSENDQWQMPYLLLIIVFNM